MKMGETGKRETRIKNIPDSQNVKSESTKNK